MAQRKEQFDSQELVLFLRQYSRVLERQITGVRGMIEEATDRVMAGIRDISDATGGGAKRAEALLEETYFKPDTGTAELLDTIQASVDELVAQSRAVAPNGEAKPSPDDNLVEARLRRFGGKFSKHMEALSTLDGDVGNLLIKMVGVLSADDVIRQKLEHFLGCLQALQKSLSPLLEDFDGNFSYKKIIALKRELLASTYSLYSSEEEKALFASIFGEEETRKAKAAAKPKVTGAPKAS